MSSTPKSILKGLTILSLVGIISKIIGALHRIPLAWFIGEQGMGIYQLVFPTYNMLLALSSAGLPVAISRMVSYSLGKQDEKNAQRIFKLALYSLLILGFISMMLMIVFSPQLARRSGNLSTQIGFIAIAPSLLIVCAMSAYRGYLQGHQNMVPTAISQLIEQIGKIVIALPFAYFGSRISIAYGAAGVLLGITISEAVSLAYIIIKCHKLQRKNFDVPQPLPIAYEKNSVLLKRLFAIAIPIALSACIVPLSGFIDSGLLLNRLIDAGIESGEALSSYGRYSGYVITLINVPSAFAAALAMNLVPSISTALSKNDFTNVQTQSRLGLRYSFLIGFPCSIGMSLLSKELLDLIFDFSSEFALVQTANLLSLSSLTIVLFTVVQSTSGILQGMKLQRIPMYTLIAGVTVKIILNYVLIGIPSIHIYGAPIASICCYSISMVPNLLYVRKHIKSKLNWIDNILRPFIATVIMAVVLLIFKHFLPSGVLWTLILVLIGIVSFVFGAILTKSIQWDDMLSILTKLRIVKKRSI